MAVIRASGASSLAPGNKWGYFPGVSAAWVISNEEFLKGSKAFNYSKLRAGWGITGNVSGIPAYSYYDLERYDDALNIIKNIPRDYFSKKKQRWRDLLTSQLEICCLIKLGRLNDLENIIYDYFVSLTKAKDTDVLMPIELVETLRSIRQVNSAKEH